ncbi:hypothetical protein TNCV_652531 [Trichonephila clavipes]|nr:hypothetical protein TNCV_652531 [Trichonephila clavipes]
MQQIPVITLPELRPFKGMDFLKRRLREIAEQSKLALEDNSCAGSSVTLNGLSQPGQNCLEGCPRITENGETSSLFQNRESHVYQEPQLSPGTHKLCKKQWHHYRLLVATGGSREDNNIQNNSYNAPKSQHKSE